MDRLLLVAMAAGAAIVAGAVLVEAQPYGPGMMGGYGPNSGGYGPGYMMGGGYGGAYGPGWMMYGGGYGPGPMMGGYGPGYGGGYGPGMMYSNRPGNQGDLNLTIDQVKQYLEQMIRNPNLTLGDIKQKDADTIVADVVTRQGNSLVQRLDFNRHNGYVQPEQ